MARIRELLRLRRRHSSAMATHAQERYLEHCEEEWERSSSQKEREAYEEEQRDIDARMDLVRRRTALIQRRNP